LFNFVFEYGVFLQYVLTVLEKPWHPACVRCSDCLAKLNEKCFARDGKIYCRDDFYRYSKLFVRQRFQMTEFTVAFYKDGRLRSSSHKEVSRSDLFFKKTGAFLI
jgi:hypothetical protein